MESEIAALFLTQSVMKMNQMTGLIERCLDELSDEQVWQRDSANENSIGNLILHLAGNIRQWIGHGLAGMPDIRERDAEFATLGDISRAELRAHLRAVVTPAMDAVAALSPAILMEKRPVQGAERSGVEIVYQVVGHLQQHAGQIIFATKGFTRKDLDLQKPLTTSGAR
jgi:uncharacterized damage-inducible protein DinB